MSRQTPDENFKDAASRYIEKYGQALLNELDALEKTDSPLPGPAAERKMRGGILSVRLRRGLRVAGAVAACLLFMFSLRFLPGNPLSGSDAGDPADPIGGPEDPSSLGLSGNLPDGAIPLSFHLPETLSVSAVKQDRGVTVYYLKEDAGDDVVLTLEKRRDKPQTEGLMGFSLNNKSFHGMITEDYCLITFDLGGVRYEMTSRENFDLLETLAYSIL